MWVTELLAEAFLLESHSVCMCAYMCVCVYAREHMHGHNPEDTSKVFLLILHVVRKLGLFSLSRHMFSSISVSQNHKMFKEKKKTLLIPNL